MHCRQYIVCSCFQALPLLTKICPTHEHIIHQIQIITLTSKNIHPVCTGESSLLVYLGSFHKQDWNQYSWNECCFSADNFSFHIIIFYRAKPQRPETHCVQIWIKEVHWHAEQLNKS